jgi:hypothetical protein
VSGRRLEGQALVMYQAFFDRSPVVLSPLLGSVERALLLQQAAETVNARFREPHETKKR